MAFRAPSEREWVIARDAITRVADAATTATAMLDECVRAVGDARADGRRRRWTMRGVERRAVDVVEARLTKRGVVGANADTR